MKLYKYKSLNDLAHVYDILIENRLHCSCVEKLNDPIEGDFIAKFLLSIERTIREEDGKKIYCSKGVFKKLASSEDEVREIGDAIRRKRVCALSKTGADVRLWSYYANGHKGISIEVDIPDADIVRQGQKIDVACNKKIFEVEYKKSLAEVIHKTDSPVVEQQSLIALRTKLSLWEHEGEVRIIQEGDYYLVPKKIERVYCGYNVSDEEGGMLRQMRRLFPHIEFTKAKLNREEPWIGLEH